VDKRHSKDNLSQQAGLILKNANPSVCSIKWLLRGSFFLQNILKKIVVRWDDDEGFSLLSVYGIQTKNYLLTKPFRLWIKKLKNEN
jgi:hypothetical protein